MKNIDNNVKVIIIVIILFFVLGIIGFMISFNSKKNSANYISCPVTKYTIVSGTIITNEMLDVKKFESSANYICSSNLIVGKCINENVMVEKGSRIKNSDLVDCEV